MIQCMELRHPGIKRKSASQMWTCRRLYLWNGAR